VALRKYQEKIKRQVDREKKEVEEWKKEDKIILSTKDLVFKERLVKKLTGCYMEPYVIEKVVLKNAVKLPAFMRIHLVVNISKLIRYRELVRE